MKKKIYTLGIIFALSLLLCSCQNSNKTKETGKAVKQTTEETAKALLYKKEKLEVISNKKFISQNVQKESNLNGWSILYADKNRILITEGVYLAELKKKGNQYQMYKAIDLLKYGMDNYYLEMGTSFYPSQDGNKVLIFNETITRGDNDNPECIPYEKNKKLKSMLINLEEEKVSYYMGNDFTELKKKEGVSEKNLAKDKKTPKSVQKIQNKFVRVKIEFTVALEENTTISSVREWKGDKARVLKLGLYTYDAKTGKTERVFGFQ